MAKSYFVKNTGNENKIPVTDGVYSTFNQIGDDIDLGTEAGVFVIAFYDSSGDPVTPSAGTITPEMSPISGQWQSASTGDSIIDATTVQAGSATYTMPTFSGPAIEGRVTLSGILGASSAVAYFWRI